MSKVILRKDETGRLSGIDDRQERAYDRFRQKLGELRIGETLAFEFKIPRSPRFHRLHFAMLGAFFAAQEVFNDAERMRKWLEVGAGHCEFVPGPNGDWIAMPKSIAYEALDDAAFRDVHDAVIAFLRQPHAYRFLWPQLDDAGREQMVEAVIGEFE
ncbi:hypothetical protein QCE63_32205 [Caballeronia sp. LZ065]|uniref:hypothetical protein n=1 Tax=Caballeronia sp. LZ065 TaxID=3038571 RepID=UPI002855221E|nr:hypothetical protein [Caballeronia sp. LZ065]MDR5784085.1 hypothetical protein [Caballeronia sp. LZ065]